MNENNVIIFNWDNQFVPEEVKEFLRKLEYKQVVKVEVQETQQESIIYFSSSYQSGNDQRLYIIIPDKVFVKDKLLLYARKELVKLSEEFKDFLKNNINYLYLFINNLNLDFLEIACGLEIVAYDSVGEITDKLKKFEKVQDYLNTDILVLAALSKKFYLGKNDSEFDKPFKIDVTSKYLKGIDSISNLDITKILKEIEFIDCLDTYNNENIIGLNQNFRTLKFLNNDILTVPNFDLFKRNLDLRILDFAANYKKNS
jgi:hypothetical protein